MTERIIEPDIAIELPEMIAQDVGRVIRLRKGIIEALNRADAKRREKGRSFALPVYPIEPEGAA